MIRTSMDVHGVTGATIETHKLTSEGRVFYTTTIKAKNGDGQEVSFTMYSDKPLTLIEVLKRV